MDQATINEIVFWAVVLTRLLVPLMIPKWPLPGMVLSLIVDAVDGSIFRSITTLDMNLYQSYDKALDIYYLAIGYLSTLRNWSHLFAFKTSRFLFYYRLVGVLLFNLTGLRWLMLVFTNAFEYFFIFYEAVRVRWDPLRMSKKTLLLALAAIVIFIKIPQEYIVHIGKINMTKWTKEELFGVPETTPWVDAFLAAPGVTITIVVLAVALLLAARWVIKNKLPPADWKAKFHADPLPDGVDEAVAATAQLSLRDRYFTSSLFEKTALVALLVVIFAQILPEVNASVVELSIAVVFVIALNTLVSQWFLGRGTEFSSMLREFLVMAVVNFGIVLLYEFVLAPAAGATMHLQSTLFFVLLLTLIVVYYNNFRPVFDLRFAAEKTAAS
jgi:hypothetical protein